MTFVSYYVCLIMTFLGYDISHIMMFVTYDVPVNECVAHRVCHSAINLYSPLLQTANHFIMVGQVCTHEGQETGERGGKIHICVKQEAQCTL